MRKEIKEEGEVPLMQMQFERKTNIKCHCKKELYVRTPAPMHVQTMTSADMSTFEIHRFSIASNLGDTDGYRSVCERE